MICKLLQYQEAPELQIDKFSVNPQEYQYFTSMFSQEVEKNISDQMGRLTRLSKITSDEVKELIKHCIDLPPETDYKNITRLLNNSYGNPHYLLASYRKERKALSSVKHDDVSESSENF